MKGLYAAGAVNNIQLTFSAQNCNLLNAGSGSSSFDHKIAAIKTLGTDIIFLSDIRLASTQGVLSENRLTNAMRDACGRKYNAYINSSKTSRGVAILVAVDIAVTVQQVIKDHHENSIFLLAEYNSSKVLLGSIYGPNSPCKDFYRHLREVLRQTRYDSAIIGGNWNTVWDKIDPPPPYRFTLNE